MKTDDLITALAQDAPIRWPLGVDVTSSRSNSGAAFRIASISERYVSRSAGTSALSTSKSPAGFFFVQ